MPPRGDRPPPGWVGESNKRGTIEKETRPAWGVSWTIVMGEKSLGLRPPAPVLVYGEYIITNHDWLHPVDNLGAMLLFEIPKV